MALPIPRSDDARDTTAEPVASAPWDPLVELEQLNRHLAAHVNLWRQGIPLLEGLFTAPADIEETDDAYLVDLELPGVRNNEFDIEIAGRRLTVRGERKEKERVGILRRRERPVGRFQYEVRLPDNAEQHGVTADLQNGVLTVRVPKSASALRREIEVL